MKALSIELIISLLVVPFSIWIVTSIFSLQSSAGTDTVKIEQVKELLEKQDKKIDNITDILINRSK
jgi:hypothetical protein